MKKFGNVLFLFGIINFVSFIVVNFLIYVRDYFMYGVRLFDYKQYYILTDFYFSLLFLVIAIIIKLITILLCNYKISFSVNKYILRMTFEKKI